MIIFLSCGCLSQIDKNRIERLTVNDGLSQNYVYCIFQDSRGLLWIGTKDGLNRYDGYRFKVYRSIPHDSTSLSNNRVQVITEDNAGNLWIGTIGGGLNRFNRAQDNFTRFLNDSNNNNSIGSNFITEIYCRDTVGVWIGTNKGHIDYYNCKLKTFSHYNFERFSLGLLGDNEINKLYQDDKGNLWISSTLGGFDRLEIKSGKVENLIDAEYYPEFKRINNINYFLNDSAGVFWIARFSGIIKYNADDRKKEEFKIIGTSERLFEISRIFKSQNNLCLLNAHKIIRFDPSTKSFNYIAESTEGFTRALCVDRTGILWLGAPGYGIVKINLSKRRFNAEPGNFLSYLYGNMLSRFEKAEPDLIDYSERGMDFRSIIRDSKGNYWIATHYWGLYKISKDLKSIDRFHKSGFDQRNRMRFMDRVFEDRNGNIWVTTVGGIDKLIESDKSFRHYKIYPESESVNFAVNRSGYQDITAIYQDYQNIYWLGTPTKGLARFDPSNGSVVFYENNLSRDPSINNNFILSIAEDPVNPHNILWIGTEGGGLNRFDKVNGKFNSFTVEQGLPNNVVYGILPDRNGFLWMSTNNGISRFDPVRFTFRNYEAADGLQSNEFNRNEYYLSPDGEMFFGGINGFNHFYPEQISNNNTIPQLTFTDFQLNKQSVPFKSPESPLSKPIWETDKVILHHYDNIITLEFAALEFSTPGKNKYVYKLEGLHNDWIENGYLREATFTNLEPGKYTFKLKGSNADGVWNEKAISIELIILPPYWQTWWFRSLVIALIFGAGVFMYKRRIKLLENETNRQKEISRILIQSQEDERKRIASEIHDSLGQELLIIKNRALIGLKNAAESSKEKIQLQFISESASNVLKLVRNLSHSLRPPELDRLGITETIRALLFNIQETTGFRVNIDIDNIDNTIRKELEINLIRIIQELLNNIIKHSKATEISVQIKKSASCINLLISDNGIGFVPSEILPGIGMIGLNERVQILHGSISINSVQNQGTTIVAQIPFS